MSLDALADALEPARASQHIGSSELVPVGWPAPSRSREAAGCWSRRPAARKPTWPPTTTALSFIPFPVEATHVTQEPHVATAPPRRHRLSRATSRPANTCCLNTVAANAPDRTLACSHRPPPPPSPRFALRPTRTGRLVLVRRLSHASFDSWLPSPSTLDASKDLYSTRAPTLCLGRARARPISHDSQNSMDARSMPWLAVLSNNQWPFGVFSCLRIPK